MTVETSIPDAPVAASEPARPVPAPASPAPVVPEPSRSGRLLLALRESAPDIELALARLGQGVGVVGLISSLLVALSASGLTGAGLAGVSVVLLALYSSLHFELSRRTAGDWIRFVPPLVEALVPAALLWVLSETAGAARAVGSWFPPLPFAVFAVASILRLDPRIPLVMGGVGAAAYGAIWLAFVRPVLAEAGLPHQPSMQLAYVGTLASIGVGAAVASAWLRRASEAAAAEPRETLGMYRLGADIASGGMGRVVDAVYAPEGGFRRRVALKLLHPHLASDPASVERFRHEAELASRLSHPNIVAALDFGRVGNTWFMAMEFVDGRTLQDVLSDRRKRSRPLPTRTVAWLGLQLALALDHAHVRARDEHGEKLRVVHRDLTPSNVMIDRAGRVRITDFGVARALRHSEVLRTKSLVGKPSYVAPETLGEQITDEQSDLWSLGVILWELLCNDRLFARDNEAASMLAVVEAPIPDPSEARTDLPSHWDALLAGLLARDRAARFRSASEVAAVMEGIATAEGQVQPEDVREMLVREDILEELALDDTSEEHPRAGAEPPAAEVPAPLPESADVPEPPAAEPPALEASVAEPEAPAPEAPPEPEVPPEAPLESERTPDQQGDEASNRPLPPRLEDGSAGEGPGEGAPG